MKEVVEAITALIDAKIELVAMSKAYSDDKVSYNAYLQAEDAVTEAKDKVEQELEAFAKEK